MSTELKHSMVQSKQTLLNIHVVECGTGPLVLFVHGFPESWYSWRHQLPVVAAAGFRAVAMDCRGYGQTDKPKAVADYSLSHLIGDVVGTVYALGETQAIIVGHDWGAPLAYFSALFRPDVFRACAILSVPYLPPNVWGPLPEGMTMNDAMTMAAGGRNYYRLFFQEPGVAEADLEKDIKRSVLGFLYLISGDVVADGHHKPTGTDGHFPAGETLSQQFIIPEKLPSWLTQADVDFYVGEFEKSGYRGGLNWYRNINQLPAILAPFHGTTIKNPTCYIGGEHDMIAGNTPENIANMKAALPDLRFCELLPGAGHWIQQERPKEVNELLLKFLKQI